jgi:arylsulfatase A-like enzyme
VSQGYNSNYLPVWLEDAGYNSYYTGKLFNAHSVTTYNDPYPAGFKHTYFLLDPHTYDYLNATFQHDKEAPVSYAGNYSTDTLAGFGYELLDNAVSDGAPFFLTLAPIAPHSNVNPYVNGGAFSAPIPAARHADLFPNVTVPRTANFNPESPSGGNWVKALPRQNQTVLDYIDYFYRQRLRSLQALDELVDGLFARLEAHGLLENTYVVYSADNGFHIGQHRLQPGKTCGYEEDINVPLIVRGPGVAKNETVDGVVTSHTDLAPTFLTLLGLPLRDGFDGVPIPVTTAQREASEGAVGEHLNVEFWGNPYIEGNYGLDADTVVNTYKALRVIGDDYSLYYSVWCNNEHELYDMSVDPGQLNNLVGFNGTALSTHPTIMGRSVSSVTARLDSLLFVLKSCKGETCVKPWEALHPDGSVSSLKEALDGKYDAFYEEEQLRVAFTACELGYILSAEGPQFNGSVGTSGVSAKVYERDGLPWDVWT